MGVDKTGYENPAATRDDLREAVNTLEELAPIARRVLGGAHPLVVDIGDEYRDAQAAFCARETLRPSRKYVKPRPDPKELCFATDDDEPLSPMKRTRLSF